MTHIKINTYFPQCLTLDCVGAAHREGEGVGQHQEGAGGGQLQPRAGKQISDQPRRVITTLRLYHEPVFFSPL